MKLNLLHTADGHVARFEALRDRIAPGAALHHEVRPKWLMRARDAGAEAVRADLAQLVDGAQVPWLCTCTTLGLVATALGALRVDWPMMQAAAQVGGPILLAYALDSTREASMALLRQAMDEAGSQSRIIPHSLAHRWPLFEVGETDGFARAIAEDTRAAVSDWQTGCIVLAQVSMSDAAAHLDDVTLPIFTAPELALRAGLKLT